MIDDELLLVIGDFESAQVSFYHGGVRIGRRAIYGGDKLDGQRAIVTD